MEQLSLNKEILKEICEKSQSKITCYPPFVADIAEKFVREIAIDFGEYLQNNYIQTEDKEEVKKEFDKFLQEKYGQAKRTS